MVENYLSRWYNAPGEFLYGKLLNIKTISIIYIARKMKYFIHKHSIAAGGLKRSQRGLLHASQ
jgi:hypothetical protein